ncbi:hypothetical protein NECID01_0211 [Nematocida sp. AWRm77]|nr:hypothetical protein NECID01_0211 [Nematocida sp. AWRm77]
MPSTITTTPDQEIIVLNKRGAVLCEWNGAQKEIDLNAAGVLLCGEYVATEDKCIYKKQNKEMELAGKTPRVVSTMCKENEGSVLYASDRLGSVYEMLSAQDVPSKFLFGSISMVTDMCVTEEHIITVDKDSKIRITRKQAPHMIEEFIMVHSKPLLATALVSSRYVISGGYDEYLSIYCLETKHIWTYCLSTGTVQEFSKDALPGVQNAESILNITQSTECGVKKILVSSKSKAIFIIGPSKTTVLSYAKETDPLQWSTVAAPGLDTIKIDDGCVDTHKNMCLFVTKKGSVYTYSLDSEKTAHLLDIPEYISRCDVSLVRKTLHRE